ncbi:MAG: ribonuclease P protein component [Chthonomonas sp.]|nr:ribonuclease P protein component [Chthonomonas sp.]
MVFREGKRERSPSFRLMSLPGSGLVGIATSKSIGCHARRNRIKRRAREVARACNLHRYTQFDWVVSVGGDSLRVPLKTLCSEISAMSEKLTSRWEGDSANG